MSVTALKGILDTKRDVSGPGFSLADTMIKKGAVLDLEYTHHLEACYCIEGKGELRKSDDETWSALEPFTLYALGQHDRHFVRACDFDLRLVCVFNPPLRGGEVHREDGSYAPAEF